MFLASIGVLPAIRNETQLGKELKDLREEVHSLVVLGMRPDLLPDEVKFIGNLERSARAEVKLLFKALQRVKDRQK